jgi:acyl-homoserine lactone acylase PvdQ
MDVFAACPDGWLINRANHQRVCRTRPDRAFYHRSLGKAQLLIMRRAQQASGTRDEHGIPQIHASDINGLYWGMGYWHMKDRGLQMLLMRILGQGRTAELLDGRDEMVDVDRFFRRMNWCGRVEEEVRKLSTPARAACDAYCRGVNARLSESVPWELIAVCTRTEYR